MNSTKTSKALVRVFNNKNELDKMNTLLKNRFPNYKQIINHVSKILKKTKKPLTYKQLLNEFQVEEKEVTHNEASRLKMLFRNIKKGYGSKLLPKTIPKSFTYLDIGAGDAKKTHEVSKYFHIPASQTYCLDLYETPFDKDSGSKVCNYIVYDAKHIPLKKKFNLISIFLTLHHIVPLKAYIQQLYNITKVGGLILIRDHDVRNLQEDDRVRILHFFYNITDKRTWKNMTGYKEKYFSFEELEQIFLEVGFHKVEQKKRLIRSRTFSNIIIFRKS